MFKLVEVHRCDGPFPNTLGEVHLMLDFFSLSGEWLDISYILLELSWYTQKVPLIQVTDLDFGTLFIL